jgi:para-aminobenzoate synthetase/4-amino-4-deoxychorismate lyase
MTSTPFVLIDDSLSGFLGGQCRLFTDPVEIVACDNPNGVADALDAIANAGARGLHAAGFMSYELGYALEPKLAGLMPPVRPVPLVWMGLFRRVRDLYWHEARGIVRAGGEKSGWDIGESRYTLDRAAYLARVSAVRDYIASGDVYQINLTFKHLFRWSGDPLFLYEELRRRQRVAHGAFIGGPGWHVLSLSPELFFETADDVIRTRPMKGTAPRGLTAKEDAALAGWLRTDEKSRAENLMIVDLLRNDLGRIAETGSVSVPALFTVESYRSPAGPSPAHPRSGRWKSSASSSPSRAASTPARSAPSIHRATLISMSPSARFCFTVTGTARWASAAASFSIRTRRPNTTSAFSRAGS